MWWLFDNWASLLAKCQSAPEASYIAGTWLVYGTWTHFNVGWDMSVKVRLHWRNFAGDFALNFAHLIMKKIFFK
jgi:hypothetical protein